MKKILTTIFCICVFCGFLPAQSLQFLNITSDAGALAVADASVAREAEGFALESNASAMALSSKDMCVALGYGRWQPMLQKDNMLSVGFFKKFSESFAAGLDVKSFNNEPYSITDMNGVVTGTFTPRDLSVSLGFAYSFAEGFSAGVVAKYVRSSLSADALGNTFGADVSLSYRVKSLGLGLSVNNIGGKISYGAEKYSMPLIARIGASYCYSGFTGSLQADWLAGCGMMAAVGLEYDIAGIVSLKAGYHYGSEGKTVPSYVSLGIGAGYKAVRVDFAYLLASKTLSNTIMLNLKLGF